MPDHSIPLTFDGKIAGRVRIAGNEHVSFELDWNTNSLLGQMISRGQLEGIAIHSIDPVGISPERQSNLVDHAARELALIGEETRTIQGYLKVIRAFADMGHSGGSASVAIPVINELLQYKNLTPLTDDPNEWVQHARDVFPPGGIWQNKRNGDAFSTDGGKTYYLLSEGGTLENQHPLHETVRTGE